MPCCRRTNFVMQRASDSHGRISTGPLQIGEDWPGVFIRGDEALAFASVLASLPQFGLDATFVSDGSLVGGMIETLRSCRKD